MSDTRVRRLGAAVGRHLRARGEFYLAPLVYLAALGFLYRQVFVPGRTQLGFGWDALEAYWADLAYFADRLRHHDWPLWDVFEKTGYPDLAIPERSHHYPVQWLLAGWGAALGEVPWWLIQLKLLAHHLIAGLLMHLYLRRRGLPPVAAAIGGLGWMASAPLLIHKASSILWPLVWTPLVWLAIDRAVARRDARSGVLLGGALGLAGSAGSAPGFFYLLLAAAPYGALRLGGALLAARPDGGATVRRVALRLALGLAVAAAITGALVLIWVVPSAELTALSQRADRSMDYATSFPLPVGASLIGLLSPLGGVHDAYLGFAIIALAAVALVAVPRADGGVPLAHAATAGLMLILAFGAATPALPWLVAHVPGFGLFRAANRFKLVAAPLVCVVAAHGAAALLDQARRRRATLVRALVGLAGPLGAVAALAASVGAVKGQAGGPALASTVGLAALAGSLALAALLGPRRVAPAALAALALLVVYDPQRYVHARSAALEPRPDPTVAARMLPGLPDLTTDGQLWDEFVLEQRPGPRLGLRELRGYPAGASLEYAPYQDLIDAVGRAPELLAAYNVHTVLWGRHHRLGLGAHVMRRPPSEAAPAFFRRVRDHVHAVIQPTPAVAWYGALDRVDGTPAEVFAAVRATLDPAAPRRVAVIEADGARALADHLGPLVATRVAPPPAVGGRVVAQRAARLEVELDAPADGVAVVAHALYPGWRVTVDGRPASPFFVDHLLRGVFVTAGHHVVVWQFRPRGHGLLLALWWAAALAVVTAALPPRPTTRKPAATAG